MSLAPIDHASFGFLSSSFIGSGCFASSGTAGWLPFTCMLPNSPPDVLGAGCTGGYEAMKSNAGCEGAAGYG